jgi:hypothetical protein
MEIVLWQSSDASYVTGEPLSPNLRLPARPGGKTYRESEERKKKERREISTLIMRAGMIQRV